jgi:hypothetical protein
MSRLHAVTFLQCFFVILHLCMFKYSYKFGRPKSVCFKTLSLPTGSRCGSAVKWWELENKWNREDLGSLPTPGNLFKKKTLSLPPQAKASAGFSNAMRSAVTIPTTKLASRDLDPTRSLAIGADLRRTAGVRTGTRIWGRKMVNSFCWAKLNHRTLLSTTPPPPPTKKQSR